MCLREKNFKVSEHRNKLLTLDYIKKYDLILSYGYRKIINKNIIKNIKRPIINLHISYLPYNRGADPNFWSFKNNTPKGVTIHEVDEGIDTGDIIFRKKIKFFIKKDTTLRHTYFILRNEIEILITTSKNKFCKELKSKKNISDLIKSFSLKENIFLYPKIWYLSEDINNSCERLYKRH